MNLSFLFEKDNIKKLASIISFLASIIIGFIAVFLPPTGIIDPSVLWFTAQLLCFTAGILGIDFNVNGIVSTKKKHRDEDDRDC